MRRGRDKSVKKPRAGARRAARRARGSRRRGVAADAWDLLRRHPVPFVGAAVAAGVGAYVLWKARSDRMDEESSPSPSRSDDLEEEPPSP